MTLTLFWLVSAFQITLAVADAADCMTTLCNRPAFYVSAIPGHAPYPAKVLCVSPDGNLAKLELLAGRLDGEVYSRIPHDPTGRKRATFHYAGEPEARAKAT